MGTSPGDSSAVDARARRRAKEWFLTPEISHPPETLAIAAPTSHPMQFRFGDVALLSHRAMAA